MLGKVNKSVDPQKFIIDAFMNSKNVRAYSPDVESATAVCMGLKAFGVIRIEMREWRNEPNRKQGFFVIDGPWLMETDNDRC